VNGKSDIAIVDVVDATTFGFLPPCVDPRFDHRSCDYWEDEVHGSKAARASWWQESKPVPKPKPRPVSDNPFASASRNGDDFNPFSVSGGDAADFNPFAPPPEVDASAIEVDAPRKLRLLDRGHAVFGSYAKVVLLQDEPAAFAQFGPLSAYPRAQAIRELYPRLPQSPPPAVITCMAVAADARGLGLGRLLVEAVAHDLAARGFSAIEAYPDLTLDTDEASAANPAFWKACGFAEAASDERFPVMRRELE
jgi:ribosomal protein S18 acetylase RimI-like enzyme